MPRLLFLDRNHHRKRLSVVAILVAGFTALAVEALATIQGNTNVFGGRKFLDDGDWEPADRQWEVGLTFDFRSDTWPVSGSAAAFYGWADDEDRVKVADGEERGTIRLENDIFEYHLGICKLWNDRDDATRFRPFVGGGLAVVAVAATLKDVGGESDHASDFGYGGWVGGGFYWNPIRAWNIGFEVRWSYAEVHLYREDVNAGGLHVGFTTGWRWSTLF